MVSWGYNVGTKHCVATLLLIVEVHLGASSLLPWYKSNCDRALIPDTMVFFSSPSSASSVVSDGFSHPQVKALTSIGKPFEIRLSEGASWIM